MRIIYTSDTHSHLFPISYERDEEVPSGLMRIAGSIEKDEDTIMIDGGDTLQGSPLSKYVFENNVSPFPQAEVFNEMGLDFVVPGNHDFNYGHAAFEKYFNELKAKLLCANLVDKTGRIEILKHVIVRDRNGLRVGITGIVTDYVNVWEKRGNLKDFIVSDSFKAAKEEYEFLKGKVDRTVLVYHGGFERDLKDDRILSKTSENVGCKIAEELSFDLILSAHQHMEVPFRKYRNSCIVQCPANGVKYAEIVITKDSIEGCLKEPSENASRHLEEKYGSLGRAVNEYLDRPIGAIEHAIEAPTILESAMNGSEIADFFNTVQLEVSKADVSETSLPNTLCGFKRNLTIRDIISSYPFPNTLVVVEAGEEELRLALERSAEFFTINSEGNVEISKHFLEPKVENYNYDYFLGISYTFDIKKPFGSRVTRLLFKGKELNGRKLKLCLNNYRASGTGGYDVYKDIKVIEEIGLDVEDIAIDYVMRRKGTLKWQKADFKVVR